MSPGQEHLYRGSASAEGMDLDDTQKAVQFTLDKLTLGLIERDLYNFGDLSPVDGCSEGESERNELRREQDECRPRETDNVETETALK